MSTTERLLNDIDGVTISSTSQAREWIRMERSRRARYESSTWKSYCNIIFGLLTISRVPPRVINRFISTWIVYENNNFIMRRMRGFNERSWKLMWQLLLELVISLIEAIPTVDKIAIGIVMMDAFDIVSFADPDKVISRLENIQDMVNSGEQWTASEPILGNTVNTRNDDDTEMKCDD